MQRVMIGVAAAAILAALAGCDSGAKAVAQREAPFQAEASSARYDRAPATARSTARRGHAEWAEGKTRSAAESAQAQFERNGAALGADSLDDYIAQAHAFATKPPKGVQMVTRRNGDVLMYDPASNVFGVFTAEGAPRTLFKPREGESYWAQQKARAQAAPRQASRALRAEEG